ncbi:hypothetical protein [Dyadobacter bucti]|uniref:hypothetical protein n=1 Tax=Dyadobacter bucti TaxID=2572203 RepID=UPI003F70692F
MNIYQFRDFQIEVRNEPSYSPDSVDHNFTYSKHYFSLEALDFPVSEHGVRLILDGNYSTSCIIVGCGGVTGISSNSSLLDGDQLLICCGDSVFCLSLPKLDLHWVVRADQITCFQIFKYNDDYIIHGELQITRLDRSGNIAWEFGGSDIFVNIDGEAFEIEPDGILLTDFGGQRYKIDFNGRGMGAG